jgi:serine/threonine protein kinase
MYGPCTYSLISDSCSCYQDNVLISDEGRALIDGFVERGILTSHASAGAIRASESYALRFYAPERAKGNLESYEADVWSFGCLLYEVFTHSVNLII